MLPSTWKVPFDRSSFLSFPCSCKRFCRCCRELDSPAKPLKWLFPSLELTAPSFPLALWKAEEPFGQVTLLLRCKAKSKRGGKETKHLQGLQKPPRQQQLCLCCIKTHHTLPRNERVFLFSGTHKSLEQCCAAIYLHGHWAPFNKPSWELPDDLLILSFLAAYCWSVLEKRHLDGLVWKGSFYFGKEKRTESLPGTGENVQYPSDCRSYH